MFAGTAGPTGRGRPEYGNVNDWSLEHSFTIAWCMNLRRRGHVPPGEISGGGSGGHTELARVIGAVDMPTGRVWMAYIKQDLRASQLVSAVPLTGSLVCISWFNLRNTTETVSFPRRRTSGDTDWINRAEFQVWLQMIARDCSMDADSSVVDNREGNTFGMDLFVPWDAPESVVDVSSAGVVPLLDLPDGMGLVGRQLQIDATESRILQGRDPRSIRVLVLDCRGFDQNFHDVTIVDMGNLPESHVSMSELAELIHKWPPAAINHMTWRQREIELMRKVTETSDALYVLWKNL